MHVTRQKLKRCIAEEERASRGKEEREMGREKDGARRRTSEGE